MSGKNNGKQNKDELFRSAPVPRALAAMAIPTIISQLINLVYNMVDAFFIGRTGNSYMMAATTVTLSLAMMNMAFANLYGVGGGSLIARLMGQRKPDEARRVSSFSLYACAGLALTWSCLIAIFMHPLLRFLGASDATIGYASAYTLLVIVLGSLPMILSQTLAHLLRSTGYAAQASSGLSGGGVLNMILDPLFMFVILPKGQEVTGAALATLISNVAACVYLLIVYGRAARKAPLGMSWKEAGKIAPESRRQVFAVGVPSAILTGLFDVANICVGILSAAHSDLVLAGMGIVMKAERVPNAVNFGLCQGMLPIVGYNYSAGSHARMRETIRTARIAGLAVSALSILLLEIFARPATSLFLSVSVSDPRSAMMTIGYAALFLRIRCLASPFQFTNYHSSFCMQAIGNGKATMLHAVVRELVFYIPFMFLLDRLFGEIGLAAALPVGEACGAVFALYLLRRVIEQAVRKTGRDDR